MAVKIILDTFKLEKEESAPVASGHDISRFYKGPIGNVVSVNEHYSSNKLKQEIIQKIGTVSASSRELGICLINSVLSNDRTKLILYGKLLDSIFTLWPDISLAVEGTLHLKKEGSNYNAFQIPLKARPLPVSKALESQIFGRPYFIYWNQIKNWGSTLLYLADLNFRTLVGYTLSYKFTWSISDFELIFQLPKTYLEDNIELSVAQEYLNKMLLDNEYADLTIVAKDGVEIKCQKSFLAVHSDVFKAMLAKGSETKESKTNRIEMVDMSGAGVRAFLQFLYSLDMTAAESSGIIAMELLEAGHKYNIKLLERTMKRLFIAWPSDWQNSGNVKVAIRLFCFAKKVTELEQLKSLAVEVLKSHSEELLESNAYDDLFKEDIDSAKELSVLFCSK